MCKPEWSNVTSSSYTVSVHQNRIDAAVMVGVQRVGRRWEERVVFGGVSAEGGRQASRVFLRRLARLADWRAERCRRSSTR